MIKSIQKVFIILAISLSIALVFSPQLSANDMSSIEYNIELHEDGSGTITETRKMYLTEDTEIYIAYDNLGGSEIIDFKVSDFGNPLTFEPNWDVNASREEKAGKYGIVETSSGVELCWGIGEYGEHEYTVTYTITNMVRQLDDGQSMIWKFFDGQDNINPEEVFIRIAGPAPFQTNNTRIWGFGYDGEIYLENGNLISGSNQALSDSNHLTILMQFLDSPFQPSLSLDQTLREQQDKAKEDSSYNSGSSDAEFIVFIILGAIFLIIFIFISIVITLRSRAIKRAGPLITGKQREKMNEDKYHRDVPYQDGAFTDIAYLLQEVNMGSVEDYFNAYMLKWLKEERISVRTEEAGRIFKKEKTVIRFKPNESFHLEFENRFWTLITSAADEDGILYDDQIKKWTQKNYKDIQKIEKDLPIKSKRFLIREGYLEEVEAKFMGGFTAKVIKGTASGEGLFNKIVCFKNYLADFSLLDEREMKEVVLWEDLLVWAGLYGIADEVAKALENFYPRYYEEVGMTYTDIYLMHLFSGHMASGYKAAVSASQGGGGATSIGGGGGSFGGGGGGSR